MDIKQMIRPEVKDFEPYLPGKPIEEVQRELGLKKIIKLASNENALGPSPKAVAALRKNAPLVFRYPEGPGTLLRRAIAQKVKVQATEVVLGAGSDEVIELLAKTFFNREDEIVVSQHAFTRYKMAADLMGCKTITVPMKQFKHDLPAMAKKITAKTKAVFIANPNNPTGTYVNQTEVEEFFSMLPSGSKPLIIFDEAYYEYACNMAKDYPAMVEYFRKSSNVIILRTFSKVYGMAGMRIGFGIMNQAIVEALDRVRPPFNVSNLAQLAAISALQDSEYVAKSVRLVKQGMKSLTERLEQMGLDYVPSIGNFLQVNVSPHKGKDVFKKLLHFGVIVRAMDEYEFPHHIRVTVGLPEENRFFIKKLKEVL